MARAKRASAADKPKKSINCLRRGDPPSIERCHQTQNIGNPCGIFIAGN
jgi:hypothetical protein